LWLLVVVAVAVAVVVVVAACGCGNSVSGSAVVGKVIIVTPSGLLGNWKAEFIKWLGTQRLKPLVVNCAGKVSAAMSPETASPVLRFVVGCFCGGGSSSSSCFSRCLLCCCRKC
jgi:hypothetical protein